MPNGVSERHDNYSFMSCVVTRYIHPIGQGAFYSERFEVDNNVIANIVYDCGTSTKPKKNAVSYINTHFNVKDKIDILFVSHFDSDHVCLLETLMNSVTAIGCVVLPALPSGKYKQILDYVITDKTSKSLINNPDVFFHNKCEKIIYVDGYVPSYDSDQVPSEQSKTNQVPSGEIKNVDQIESGTHIQNGQSISISKLHMIWKFKPYHICDDSAVKQFLSNYSPQIKKLTLDNNADSKLIKELRDGFKRYYKNLNDYSLLMYSGPLKMPKAFPVFFSTCNTNRKFHSLPDILAGCLYTGDANFNMKGFDLIEYSKTILEKDANQIGLVQISHHGSATSYNPDILKEFHAINYFLSCGIKNNYCHPSFKVVSSVMGNGNNLMITTENHNTKIEQRIVLY